MLNNFFRSLKVVFISALSILCLGCSSKFNIYVDLKVAFNKMGAGSYAMKINFANIGNNMIFRTFGENEKVAYEYMERLFKEVHNKLRMAYTDNNPSFSSNKENQEINLSFNFKAIDELNDILKMIYGRQIFSYQYRTDRNTKERKFVLTNQVDSLENFGLNNFLHDDDSQIKWFSIRTMLSHVKIFRTYQFEEKICRISSEKVKVSEDRKTASIKCNLWKFSDPKRQQDKIQYVIAFN